VKEKTKTLSKLRITSDINYLKTDGKVKTPNSVADDYQTILSPESEPNQIFENFGGSEKYLPKKRPPKVNS
jgi:hypothetical protein